MIQPLMFGRPPEHPTWYAEEEIDTLRSLCLKNFWFYFQWGFGAAANPKGKKWIDDDIHKPLADWYQHHVEEWLTWRKMGVVKTKRLAVVVHRGVGKTTMLAQAGQSWLHLLDPEISTYTLSEKLESAIHIVNPIKAVMDGSDRFSLWETLFGNWCGNARTWKATEVTHAARKNTARRDPSLGVAGVETSITGAHPDAYFRDDPTSYTRLESDSDWLTMVNKQTDDLIPILQADGLAVDVGTRYGDSDHFGSQFSAPDDGGFGVASVSGMSTDAIRINSDDGLHVYFMAGRDGDGKPTTVKVWPEHKLRYYKQRNPVRYAAQIMNDPADSEFNPITRAQLAQTLVSWKDVPHNLSIALLCDLALWDGRKRINKDETVWLAAGYPRNGSGDVYLLDGNGSMYWRDEDMAKQLVMAVQRFRRGGYRIKGITNDKPYAGMVGTWGTVLKNRFSDVNEPCPILYEFNRGGTHKIKRIAAAVNFWIDSHVFVVTDFPGASPKWHTRLFEQMEKIGEMLITAESGRKSKRKDDWIDAGADAFQPELYQVMRRPTRAQPYARDARALEVDGLDTRIFDDDELRDWREQNPREPL